MKIYKDEYHRNGNWTIKSRTEYTKSILENQEYFKEYFGNEFHNRMFLKIFFKVTERRRLTKTLIAKVLKISRFTLYSIKDGHRKLKPREVDLLYTICLEEEFTETIQRFTAYNERIKKEREDDALRRRQR